MQCISASAGGIFEYFTPLRYVANNTAIAFVRNMDKVGHSDLANTHPEAVSVAAEFDADFIP
jgi:hypothetical protein